MPNKRTRLVLKRDLIISGHPLKAGAELGILEHPAELDPAHIAAAIDKSAIDLGQALRPDTKDAVELSAAPAPGTPARKEASKP